MVKTLYVGNLAHETTEADLKAAFSNYGEVLSTKVASNRHGRTKQFGYVEMADAATAQTAMAALRGTEINGRILDIVLEERGNKRKGSFRRSGRRR